MRLFRKSGHALGACILSLIPLMLCSCSHPEKITIERLDTAASANTRELTDSFTPALQAMAPLFGQQSPGDVMEAYRSSDAQQVFAPDIASRLGSLDRTEAQLGIMRQEMASELPSVRFPARIFGIATPYRQSVMVCDSVIIIGLNHYLGPDYPGYASFEGYIRSQKTVSRIAADVAEALIATTYPYAATDNPTVLSRLLYEGALMNAVATALPSETPAELLGYDDSEIDWVTQNESAIWQHLVSTDLLFSTDPATADRLVRPAPSTPAVNPAAPGRVGRFIGMRIVRSYLSANPDSTVESTLRPTFYNSLQTLKNASYFPR